ncbi:MAG: hypothetical protein RIU67_1512 [Actinomycetota bacterium]|jgi:alpha-D-ribose 1-methylphosphonate 5-triphosphate diphosphatase
MSRVIVTNTRAVLRNGYLDDATIVCDQGRIVDVLDHHVAFDADGSTTFVDARRAMCLPGLVDTHSDGLERERFPRPGVDLGARFTIRSFEGRVRAAGITTMFHGIGFEDDEKYHRSIQLANEWSDELESYQASGKSLVDHRVLYRLDARDPYGFDALVDRLPRRWDDGALPLVSFEDHTPGQGQYTDRTAFERYIVGTQQLTEEEARRRVDQLIAERDELLENRERALPWLVTEAQGRRLRLMAHDPATTAESEEAHRWHASIAEFPTTLEAARRAKELGLRTVCGAPNVLRGRSHSGNVSARELIALGLCDGLASDYLPSTMLGAVAVLVDSAVCDLATAVRLVTSGPAETVGLTDRGAIEVGLRADLVLARFDGSLATVESVLRAEDGLRGEERSLELQTA